MSKIQNYKNVCVRDEVEKGVGLEGYVSFDVRVFKGFRIKICQTPGMIL